MGGAATALTGGNTPHLPLPSDVQYLVFPRVPQGADKRPVATHGVSTDGHPLGVGGEVSVDQFGELRDRQTALAGSEVKQFEDDQVTQIKRTSSVT